MLKQTLISALLIDEQSQLSFLEICQSHQISEQDLLDILNQGLLSHVDKPHSQLSFAGRDLKRLRSACRLYRDLGINPEGLVVILDLLEELERLEQELKILERHRDF